MELQFKEDYPELGNSRVADILDELKTCGILPFVHDPLADVSDAQNFFGVRLSPWDAMKNLDAMIIAVGHGAYKQLLLDEFIKILNPNGCISDIKSILDIAEVRKAGVHYWRL